MRIDPAYLACLYKLAVSNGCMVWRLGEIVGLSIIDTLGGMQEH